MTILEQYKLVFRIFNGHWKEAVCELSYNDSLPHWENEIANFLDISGVGFTETQIETIQKIIDETWDEAVDDDVFIHDSLEKIRFDLNNGFVYFNEGTRTDGVDIKIPLLDYKEILEEWLEFLNNMANPPD